MNRSEKIILNLPTYHKNINNRFFYYASDINNLKIELEELIKNLDYMNNKDFAKKVLFPYEVKFNNAIEQYNDDIVLIEETINHKTKTNSEQKQRILNLYNGYKYILKNNIVINKDNLKNLYCILSKNLLKQYDLDNMGDYYRNGAVFLSSAYIGKPEIECINYNLIPEYMEYLFSYINSDNNFSTLTDYYIKSQIIHFYFVYLHPYFDINGRTSRTTSMWYLLNNQKYPFIIFNRGITKNRNYYCNIIDDTIKFSNCSYFINYMLKTVIEEIEKEYLINIIDNSIDDKLNITDIQSLHYIFSLNGLKTVKDFAKTYNRFNTKKHYLEIYKTMISPLLEKEVLNKIRDTKNHISNDINNFVFDINYKKLDIDKEKVKHLKLNF